MSDASNQTPVSTSSGDRALREPFLALGALLQAAAVAAGAFGAHGLEGRLDAAALELWETAARYLFYGGLGTALVGLARRATGRSSTAWNLAGWALAIGALVFGTTVGLLALGGPRWLGAVTPLGGASMIVGFVALALGSRRR